MKMHRHKKLLLFIIQATLLSVHFRGFFSLNCSNNPFNCGNIRHIAYPFWGGNRSQYCGRPGFELHCNNDVPILNISSVSYQVQAIDFTTNTLRIAIDDIWTTVCPRSNVIRNTTIDPDLSEYSLKSNDKNLTLYFNCTGTDQGMLLKRFRCNGDDSTTINFFEIGNESPGPGFGITCSKSVFVPINDAAAKILKNPMASAINDLGRALAYGFSINWKEDEFQHSDPFCNHKIGGSCNYTQRSCSYNNLCHREGQDQSVGSNPKSEDINHTGNRIPQVQSPWYPFESGDAPYSQSGSVLVPGKSSPPARIIVGAILGIIGFVIISIAICCYYKRVCSLGSPNQGSDEDVESILLQHGSLALKRYKFSEIKKITKSFNDSLGQGGYGRVYKGILSNGCPVAVKVLIETNSNGEEFINEVASISRTSHVNVVNLLGFCYDGNKRALVYEFMPNKSLDKFISPNANGQLDLEKLYKIALGVAKGLEYLHAGCNTRIVHFDIKPQNILLGEDFCPKISDFGLAKLCKMKQSILSMLGARGTIGYIAPEIFSRIYGGVSHKSDVYSYGMMILEMLGARSIIEIEEIQSNEIYFPDKIYEQVIIDVTKKIDDFKIEKEDNITRKMFLVGFWCIQTFPSDRPSMSKVVEMLEGSLQSIQIPPKPFLFSPKLTGHEFSSSFSTRLEIENSGEEFC